MDRKSGIKIDVNGYLHIISAKKIILPTTFECKSCNLTINGYSLLHAAGLGDQYTVEETYDPIEYYNIEFDPRDYFEPDYGND